MASLAVTPVLRRASSRTAALFVKETRYEFLKLFRTRSFSLSVIGFPVMFYLIFGLLNKHAEAGGYPIQNAMLVGYVCFGLVGAALFGIGVGMATERAMGWLELKQASPMPPPAYLAAKCLTAMAFGLIIACILAALAVTLGGAHLTPARFAGMLLVTACGSVPFAALGLLLALTVPANAAPGIVNLIYLPMSFLSGLWIPLHFLPHWVQTIAPALPTYHLAQLMFAVFGLPQASSMGVHWLYLLGFTLLALGLSWMVFRRAEQNS